MRQVVDLHCLLVSIDTPLGIGQGRLVDTGIANQSIDRLAQFPFLEIVTKISDTLKGVEFTFHGRKALGIKTIQLGHSLHLVDIAHGAHDMVLACPKECQSRLASQPRRRSCYNNQFYTKRKTANQELVNAIRVRSDSSRTSRTLVTKLVLHGGFLFHVDGNWKLPLGHELKGAAALQEDSKGDESDAGNALHGRILETRRKSGGLHSLTNIFKADCTMRGVSFWEVMSFM